MAGFEDCIRSAQKQGAFSEDEADALIERYNEHRDARRVAGDLDAEAGAKAGLAKEVEAQSARLKERARLAKENRDMLWEHASTWRDRKGRADAFEAFMRVFENHGYDSNVVGLAQQADAITRIEHGLLDTALEFSRSRITGRRFNKPTADDVVREIYGKDTGNEAAKAFAKNVQDSFERLRTQFNRWGGDIGKLDWGYLPQHHNPAALLKAEFEAWRDNLKPKLDLNKMADPLTGGRLTDERLNATMKVAFDRITTGGWSEREPKAQPFGLGALSERRSDHRFFHFKSADDWLAYNKDFGRGDPMQAIFQHIRAMGRDIAALKTLGPNPNATVEWMKQVTQSEAGKFIKGDPSALYSGTDKIKAQVNLTWNPYRIGAFYNAVRGTETIDSGVANFFGSVRNVLTSAQLTGTAIQAASQDPFIDMAARHLSGLPQTKAMWDILTALSKEKREIAVRAGLGAEDLIHITGEEARYAGQLGGSEKSRWLAERTVNLTGLSPLTESRRHGFGLDFMSAMADSRENAFADLPNFLRHTLEDYGLHEKDWNRLREFEPHKPQPDSAGILRPVDVAKEDYDLGTRYLGMILGQTERAVPTGTARSRYLVSNVIPRGTWVGEIANSVLQYKSFSLSLTTLQLQALSMEMARGTAGGALGQTGGMAARGAAYAGSMFIALTMAGAFYEQIKNLLNSKDLQSMDPSTGDGIRFWIAAAHNGGGLGVLGDYAFQDTNRFGQSYGESLLGPTLGLGFDLLKTGSSLVQKEIEGMKPRPGREAVRLMGRYTPLVGHPATRQAYRRIVLDQLQNAVDPEAHKYWRRQEQKMRHETGQGFYWKSGETSPQRGPVWATSPARH